MRIKTTATAFISLVIFLFPIHSRAEIIYSQDLTTTTTEPYDATRPLTIYSSDDDDRKPYRSNLHLPKLSKSSRPQKVIIVNPRTHRWAAYTNGRLIRSGTASAGARWCEDLGRPCRTKVGTFQIYSLGGRDCYSKKFPLGQGGAPMPYCMYFNGGQGLHGSNDIYGGNKSHGCVRISVGDARWLRFNFANIGTTVIVKSY